MARATPVSLDEAYRHCRIVTRERAKNFYYAFLSLPARQRRAIYAVYAFCRGCDDYSDEPMEPGRKLELLEDYRQQLARSSRGEPSGPVFVALHDASQRYHIPLEYFDEIINGVQMDLTISRYNSFEELHTYCYRVASVVGLISIQVFGYSAPQAREHAINLGVAMQLVNILRDVKEDAQRDRIYLPLSELEEFGYSEADLFGGVINEPFVELMQFQAQRARRYFEQSGPLLPLLPIRSRPCSAILRGLYTQLLNRIESRRYNVYDGPVRLSTSEKLWLVSTIWTKTLLKSLLLRGRSLS